LCTLHLDRLDPVLPLSPGRAERHGFEYYRHGTLSQLAALDTKSGEVLADTVPRHTSAAFVEFLGDIVASQPKGREIHVIAGNLSTHKTQAVRTFLLEHQHVHLHFTPTYFSCAQPGRTLVRQDRARSACARRLYVGRRSRAQDSSLHPALQHDGETGPLALSQSGASHYSTSASTVH
jgi:DDE superfamily endonuclease